MKKVVISLGGSVIVPDKVDYKFLNQFKKLILKFANKNKVVIVTGGGSTCRKYLKPLEKEHYSHKVYSLIGIASTKLNARLVDGIFGRTDKIPETLLEVKISLRRKNIVICGALGFKPESTSDGNAAEVARMIKADFFVNITNIKGLYDRHPKLKGAKFIPSITFDDFWNRTKKIKFKAGQHFVLDKLAAKIIKRAKIKTYIVGNNIKNLENLLYGRKFIGTTLHA